MPPFDIDQLECGENLLGLGEDNFLANSVSGRLTVMIGPDHHVYENVPVYGFLKDVMTLTMASMMSGTETEASSVIEGISLYMHVRALETVYFQLSHGRDIVEGDVFPLDPFLANLRGHYNRLRGYASQHGLVAPESYEWFYVVLRSPLPE